MAKVSDPFAMSNVLSAASLTAILINAAIVVRWGRRRVLLMGGFALAAIFQLIVAVVYDKKPGQPSTGQVIVALSCLYMMAYNGMIGKPKPKSPPLPLSESPLDTEQILSWADARVLNSNVRLGRRRRDPLAALAQLHLRTGRGRRLLRRLADDLHGALLHQRCGARLGPPLRLHLVPFVHNLGHLGLFLPARDQGPDTRGDRRDGTFVIRPI